MIGKLLVKVVTASFVRIMGASGPSASASAFSCCASNAIQGVGRFPRVSKHVLDGCAIKEGGGDWRGHGWLNIGRSAAGSQQ